MIENFLDALSGSPTLLVGLCVLMGLLVGSFLNVVIYRLPVMMERGWKQEAREILELHTLGVDGHHLVPILGAGVLDQHVARAHSGVVDQYVQLAKPLNRGGDGAFPLGEAGNIQLHKDTFSPSLADLRRQPFPFFPQHVADSHPRTLSGKQPCLASTHPPGAPADESYLVFETHGLPPVGGILGIV